jgi:hypothetical protein
MENRANKQSLLMAYRVPGFRARARIDSYEVKHPAFVITLDRRQKNGVRSVRRGASQLL